MLYDKHDTSCHLTLPLPHAHFIWYSAWLSLPTAIYAYINAAAVRNLAIIPAAVWSTSLLYWRHPVRDSWRRTLDIAVVFTGVTYQTYYAFRNTSPTRFAYYTALITASASCYITSNWLMNRGILWPATYAHASIHLLANVANMVLYYDGLSFNESPIS